MTNEPVETTDYSSLPFGKVFINSSNTDPLCHF
jgi:hypothetical protein